MPSTLLKKIHCAGLGLSILALLAAPAPGAGAPQLTASATRTGQYEKIEFQINKGFLIDNPDGPKEDELSLEIQAPDGNTIILPVFSQQPYEYRRLPRGGRPADWFYPSGNAIWSARFAPAIPGRYQVRARSRNNPAAPELYDKSAPLFLECLPSSHTGFVRVARRNPRYFELGTGGAFFPIGQNLAFIGDGQYADLGKAREIFQKMSLNGANYARIWACCGDWAMALEANKSAWGRSWDKKSPLVAVTEGSGPSTFKGNVVQMGGDQQLSLSPTHPVALKPGTRYMIAVLVHTAKPGQLTLDLGGRRFITTVTVSQDNAPLLSEHTFTAGPDEWWLPPLSLRTRGCGQTRIGGVSLKEQLPGTSQGPWWSVTGPGPDLLWEADPGRPTRGVYNPVDCFMLDKVVEAAEQNGIRLQLCFITRDLYMDALKNESGPDYDQAIRDAKKLARYAVARWGYSTAVASWEYWNEQNPGLPTDRFYDELGRFFDQNDPYHHLRATSAWGPSEKDWRHPALDVADLHWYLRPAWGPLWKDEVAAVLDRAAFLRQRAPNRPALLSEFGLADDKWGLSPFMKQDAALGHVHNALWASALSGLSGTALFWWWEQLDALNAYPHYKALAAFLADIPFATVELRPAAARVFDARVRVVGLEGGGGADLWISNGQAAWARRVIDRRAPVEVRDATFELRGLAPGQYRLAWWDTAAGRVLGQEVVRVSEDAYRTEGSVLRHAVPSFTSDIALKVRRVP